MVMVFPQTYNYTPQDVILKEDIIYLVMGVLYTWNKSCPLKFRFRRGAQDERERAMLIATMEGVSYEPTGLKGGGFKLLLSYVSKYDKVSYFAYKHKDVLDLMMFDWCRYLQDLIHKKTQPRNERRKAFRLPTNTTTNTSKDLEVLFGGNWVKFEYLIPLNVRELEVTATNTWFRKYFRSTSSSDMINAGKTFGIYSSHLVAKPALIRTRVTRKRKRKGHKQSLMSSIQPLLATLKYGMKSPAPVYSSTSVVSHHHPKSQKLLILPDFPVTDEFTHLVHSASTKANSTPPQVDFLCRQPLTPKKFPTYPQIERENSLPALFNLGMELHQVVTTTTCSTEETVISATSKKPRTLDDMGDLPNVCDFLNSFEDMEVTTKPKVTTTTQTVHIHQNWKLFTRVVEQYLHVTPDELQQCLERSKAISKDKWTVDTEDFFCNSENIQNLSNLKQLVF